MTYPQPVDEREDNWLNNLKSRVRRYPILYEFITWTIAPCYIPLFLKRRLLDGCPPDAVILNLGSGTTRYRDDVVNVDIQRLQTTDVCADLQSLPFASGCADRILCISVLEHVPNTADFISEMHRVLRPGGQLRIVVPFLFGFHAAPHDYYRWTDAGLKEAFKQFEKIEVSVSSGPTSSLLAILHEWLALAFSFNSVAVYRVLSLVFMVALSPFKFIDLLLVRHKEASVIGCTFLLSGEKGVDGQNGGKMEAIDR